MGEPDRKRINWAMDFNVLTQMKLDEITKEKLDQGRGMLS